MDPVTLNMVTMTNSQSYSTGALSDVATTQFASVFEESVNNFASMNTTDCYTDNYSDSTTNTTSTVSNTVDTTTAQDDASVNQAVIESVVDEETLEEIACEVIKELQKGNSDELDKGLELSEEVQLEIMELIASQLGITMEQVQEMMVALDISTEDILVGNGLQALMNEVFEVSSELELLTNSEMYETYKSINESIEKIVNREMDLEDINVEEMMTSSSATTQSSELTSNDSEESIDIMTLEVSEEGTVESDNKDFEGSSSENQEESFENIFSEIKTQKVETVNIGGVQQVIYSEVSAQDIIDQIVTNVKVIATSESSTMSFQLNPENLGKVAFSVTSENGMITGKFVAENSTVKEAIEMNIANLKANLDEQGIKVDDIKVVVGNTSEFFEKNEQESNNQALYQRNNKKHTSIESIEDEELDDLSEVSRVTNNYNLRSEYSVEYSA